MKKVLCLLMTTVMLFGCKQSHTDNASSTAETTTTAESIADVIACGPINYYFESMDEFRASEFYAEFVGKGYVPYIPVYDEERYTLDKVYAIQDELEYTYYFIDNNDGEQVEYYVRHNVEARDVFEMAEEGLYDRTYAETVEFGGVSYDIFIHATEYAETLNHAIECYTYPDCQIHMWAGLNATKEEAIECFGDFTLAPDNIE